MGSDGVVLSARCGINVSTGERHLGGTGMALGPGPKTTTNEVAAPVRPCGHTTARRRHLEMLVRLRARESRRPVVGRAKLSVGGETAPEGVEMPKDARHGGEAPRVLYPMSICASARAGQISVRGSSVRPGIPLGSLEFLRAPASADLSVRLVVQSRWWLDGLGAAVRGLPSGERGRRRRGRCCPV